MDVRTLVRALSSLGALSVLALSGCDEDPLEGGRGEPELLVVSRTETLQSVGATFSVTAQVEDQQRMRLPAETQAITAVSSRPTVVAIDSVVFVPELTETRVFARAVLFDTATITVTGGGFTEDVTVIILPAGIQPSPAMRDTLGSGETEQIVIEGLDVAGNSIGPVPFEVIEISDEDIIEVDENGVITAKAPGLAEIEIEGPGGELTTTVRVTVVPGTFQGTVTPAGGSGGDTITITAGAGQEPFDADTRASLSGAPIFFTSQSATQLVGVLPFGVDGTQTLNITGIGAGQLALATTYTITQQDDDPYEPNNTTATPTFVTFPVNVIGSTSGSDVNDYYAFTPTASATYGMLLEWDTANGSQDLDVILRNHATGALVCFAASAAIPESTTCALSAGTVYRVQVNDYEADVGGPGTVTTYQLTID